MFVLTRVYCTIVMSNKNVITEENVREQLDSFDIRVTDPVVLSRIQETCNQNGISADKFVDEWITHSLKDESGELNFILTPNDMDKFLPELLRTSVKQPSDKPVSMVRIDNKRQGEPVAPEDLEMIEKYADEETKEKARREINTIQALLTMDERDELTSPVSKPDPVEETPYAARKNATKIVASIHEHFLPEEWQDPNLTTSWKNSSPPTERDPCTIELVSAHPAVPPLTAPYKYMYPQLEVDAQVMNEQTDDIAELIAAELDIPGFETLETSGQNIWWSGRVAPDFDNEDEHESSNLRSTSFAIMGTKETSIRHRWAKLDLSALDRYSVFPGQNIAVCGFKNPDENIVFVKELRIGVPPPLISRPVTTHPLNVYIVSGPYTPDNNLGYQPLKDFIRVINEAKPDLLIMTGPFVADHTTALRTEELQCNYTELFRRKVELVLSVTSRIGTRVVLIPSLKDMFHHPIYPQPPYSDMSLRDPMLRGLKDKVSSYSLLFPNPAQFDCNTVRFAVTSADIITHMAMQEVAVEMKDKFSRILGHLFLQRRFYPLYPPSEEINLEITRSIHLAINERPHILIVPSQMKEFLKLEGPTLCVNPGRLVKGNTGGSFCRLRITEEGFSGQIIKI